MIKKEFLKELGFRENPTVKGLYHFKNSRITFELIDDIIILWFKGSKMGVIHTQTNLEKFISVLDLI